MKELEKAIDQLKKENDRIEKVQNRAKLLNQKINKPELFTTVDLA